jgi:hypothetical protein
MQVMRYSLQRSRAVDEANYTARMLAACSRGSGCIDESCLHLELRPLGPVESGIKFKQSSQIVLIYHELSSSAGPQR